jgi:hypothetical protein
VFPLQPANVLVPSPQLDSSLSFPKTLDLRGRRVGAWVAAVLLAIARIASIVRPFAGPQGTARSHHNQRKNEGVSMLIKKFALALVFALASVVSVSNVTGAATIVETESVRPTRPVMQGFCSMYGCPR